MIPEKTRSALTSLMEERYNLSSTESRLLADNILDVANDILKGTRPERILDRIQLFLEEFKNDLSILQQKRLIRVKSAGQKQKKRTQLDIFS